MVCPPSSFFSLFFYIPIQISLSSLTHTLSLVLTSIPPPPLTPSISLILSLLSFSNSVFLAASPLRSPSFPLPLPSIDDHQGDPRSFPTTCRRLRYRPSGHSPLPARSAGRWQWRCTCERRMASVEFQVLFILFFSCSFDSLSLRLRPFPFSSSNPPLSLVPPLVSIMCWSFTEVSKLDRFWW